MLLMSFDDASDPREGMSTCALLVCAISCALFVRRS